jgi:hypothetical protein
MRGSRSLLLAGVAGGLAVAAPLSAQQQQRVTGPQHTYWVSGVTMGGMGAMAGGGMGSMMGMAMGRAPADMRMMELDLGSRSAAAANAKADHLLPPSMRMGASVPLKIWVDGRSAGPDEPEQMPRLRLKLFWGCGERAGPGQPVVIDFSKVARGEIPKEYQAFRSLDANVPQPPRPGRWATYANWPNDLERRPTMVRADSSLVGAHTVRTAFTPDINFTVPAGTDFMPGLRTQQRSLPSKAIAMSWGALAPATGYYLQSIGFRDEPDERRQPDEIVIWSSSAMRGLLNYGMDHIPPAEVARLIRQNVVLSPQTTTCTVPAEVIQAANYTMINTNAFGPEVSSSYPPRPSDPKVAWNIEYTTKVRLRAMSVDMAGMDMQAMMSGRDPEQAREERAQSPEEQRKGNRRRLLEGIAGAIPR